MYVKSLLCQSQSKIRRWLALARRWFFIALPLAGLIFAGCLPLPLLARQALVGIALLWFQLSWMLGLFN